jgi:hypothetical protein
VGVLHIENAPEYSTSYGRSSLLCVDFVAILQHLLYLGGDEHIYKSQLMAVPAQEQLARHVRQSFYHLGCGTYYTSDL